MNKLKDLLSKNHNSNEYNTRVTNLFKKFLNYVISIEKTSTNGKKENYNYFKNKFHLKKLNLNNAIEFIKTNKRFKSKRSKYFLLYRLKKYLKDLNGEQNLRHNLKNISIQKP